MKYLLPLIIIVPLLIPIFVSAQFLPPLLTGPHGEMRGCDEDNCCVAYKSDVPCTGNVSGDYVCFRNYCAQKSCSGLWDNGEYCALTTCCGLSKIQRFLYFIGTGLAIIVITWAGIMYMTSGGEERASKAKKVLLYGLIGAAIIFTSGYILSFVFSFLY